MNLLHQFASALGRIAGSTLMWVLMTREKLPVHIDPVTRRVLTILTRETGRSAEDLLCEALRDLYAKHREREG